MGHTRLKPWEPALAAALIVSLLAGVWADRTQEKLASDLIRLHVVAASDSEEDQAAKLAMRDRVLTVLAPALEGCTDRDGAEAAIRAKIPALEAPGGVTVTLGTEYYPTRRYDTFSLPAGEYLSLRVVMGQGRGHNWWCVVFPPLCTEAVAEDAEDAFLTLDGDETALITQADEGYVIKFRVVELWGQLKERFKPGA